MLVVDKYPNYSIMTSIGGEEPAYIYINSLITGDNADALPLIFIFRGFLFTLLSPTLIPLKAVASSNNSAGPLLCMPCVNTVYNLDL